MAQDNTETEDRRKWRVFYTRSRTEKQCEKRLEQQDIDAFLPKNEVVRQWKDRKKKVIEPLFRNYIFAHIDEQERLAVLKTPGIVRCVSFGGMLAEVDPAEVEQLKIAQQDPARLRLVDGPLLPLGETVTITEGPLRGLCGEVSEHRGQYHLIIRITAIQQAVRVHVPTAWVKPDDTLSVS